MDVLGSTRKVMVDELNGGHQLTSKILGQPITMPHRWPACAQLLLNPKSKQTKGTQMGHKSPQNNPKGRTFFKGGIQTEMPATGLLVHKHACPTAHLYNFRLS